MYSSRVSSDRLQLSAAFKFFTDSAAALPAGPQPLTVVQNTVTKKVRVKSYYDSEQPELDESFWNHALFLDFPKFAGGLVLVHEWCAMPWIAVRTHNQPYPLVYGYPFVDTLTQFSQDMGGLDYSLFTVKRFQSVPVIAIPIPYIAGPTRMVIEGFGAPGPNGVIVEVYTPRRIPIKKATSIPWGAFPLVNNAEGIYQSPSLEEWYVLQTMMPSADVNQFPDRDTSLGYGWFIGTQLGLLDSHAALESDGTVPKREFDYNSVIAESGAQVLATPFNAGIAHWPEPV